MDENALPAAAAAVESNATHPLANAIVQAAFARKLDIPAAEAAQTEPGAGMPMWPASAAVKARKPDYCCRAAARRFGRSVADCQHCGRVGR